MRKRSGIFLAALVSISLAARTAPAGDGVSKITHLREPIRVYVGAFMNAPGEQGGRPELVREKLKSILPNWKIIRFELTETNGTSDIEISGVIKKYSFIEEDPVAKALKGASISLDSTSYESYAEMDVEFEVRESRMNRVIWKNTVSTFLRKKMASFEGPGLISEKISMVFLIRAFGRPPRA